MLQLSREQAAAALDAIEQEELARAGGKLAVYFPDCAPTCVAGSPDKADHRNPDGSQRYCRALYPKHLAFFEASRTTRESMLLAGNRTGKSQAGAYATTLHLTGLYPPWWRGRRFTTPTDAWACGDTSTTARDIVQAELLGPLGRPGTGFIPRHLLLDTRAKRGGGGGIDTAWVQHNSGGISTLQVKGYQEGRESFQGTAKHLVWLDEEPPMDVYAECLLRTTATGLFEGGITLLTFTPLSGPTELILSFLPELGIQEDER
jgi:phage terminase large subunit-like protein